MAPGAGAGSIQLDEDHRIVRVGQGVNGGDALRVAVDRKRLGNRRERDHAGAGIGANVDGLHARARDVEVDGVVRSESAYGVRRDVRIAEVVSGINRGDRFAKRHAPINSGNVITRRVDGDGSGRRALGPQQDEQSNNAAR